MLVFCADLSTITHSFKMATTTVSNFPLAMSRPRIPSSQKFSNAGPAILGCGIKVGSCDKLASVCHVASLQPFQKVSTSCAIKFDKIITKAMSESSSNKQVTGLPIDLRGFASLSMNPSYLFCLYLHICFVRFSVLLFYLFYNRDNYLYTL